MCRKNCSGSIDHSRPTAFRAVQKQDRGKRAVAGRTVTPTPQFGKERRMIFSDMTSLVKNIARGRDCRIGEHSYCSRPQ
jgi:hypothetical protein